MPPASKIRRVFFAFLSLLGLAFALPAFAAGGQAGLAAAATAALTFLLFALLALASAILLLVMGLRHRAVISSGAKILAFLPLPLLAVAGMIFFGLARQKMAERRQQQTAPATLAPTAGS